MPSPQFRIVVEDESICKWDEKNSRIIAKKVGSTRLTLIDTSKFHVNSLVDQLLSAFEEFSSDLFEHVKITVVQPDSVGFIVDRGDNWHFQLDLDYRIHVKLRDSEGNDLFIPTVGIRTKGG